MSCSAPWRVSIYQSKYWTVSCVTTNEWTADHTMLKLKPRDLHLSEKMIWNVRCLTCPRVDQEYFAADNEQESVRKRIEIVPDTRFLWFGWQIQRWYWWNLVLYWNTFFGCGLRFLMRLFLYSPTIFVGNSTAYDSCQCGKWFLVNGGLEFPTWLKAVRIPSATYTDTSKFWSGWWNINGLYMSLRFFELFTCIYNLY